MRKPKVAFVVLPEVVIRHLPYVKLLSHVKGTSVNDDDLYKFKIPVRGRHCDIRLAHRQRHCVEVPLLLSNA